MRDLICNKIKKYNTDLYDLDISYSNHPLIVDELIDLYKARNNMAKEKVTKELTLRIYNDLCQIKERSIESIKMVSVKKKEMTIIFFFTEDYSVILSDYIFKDE